jgi:hypothetical protein
LRVAQVHVLMRLLAALLHSSNIACQQQQWVLSTVLPGAAQHIRVCAAQRRWHARPPGSTHDVQAVHMLHHAAVLQCTLCRALSAWHAAGRAMPATFCWDLKESTFLAM